MINQDYEKACQECWEEFKKRDYSISFKDTVNFAFDYAYRLGMEAAKKQPLAERLTEEEKECVKANYADAKDIHSRCVGTMSKNHIADLHNEYNKGFNMGIMIVLKHLFGKEFFNETKEENNG